MKFAIFCLLIIALGEAPVARGDGFFSFGRCPTYTSPLTTLNIANYASVGGSQFFEYSRLLGTLEANKYCNNVVITLGSSPEFTFVFKEYSTYYDTYYTFPGFGSFATTVPFSPQLVTVATPYGTVIHKTFEALNADNNMYFIIKECRNVFFGIGNIQRAWVFTSLREPSISTLMSIQTNIRAVGLPPARFKRTYHNNCPP